MNKHNNAVSVCDFIGRQLDELPRWGADFSVERKTERTLELTFNDGTRVVVRVSNAPHVSEAP